MDELSIEMELLRLMKQFNVSKEKAAELHLDMLKHKHKEIEQSVSPDTLNKFKELLSNQPAPQQLEEIYQNLIASESLATATITDSQLVYIETEDFVGEKELLQDTVVQVNKDLVEKGGIAEIWLDSCCVTYVNTESLSFQS